MNFQRVFEIINEMQAAGKLPTPISRMTRRQQILESKAAYRRQLARKPIAEKLRIVEQLAERTSVIRKSRLQDNSKRNAGHK